MKFNIRKIILAVLAFFMCMSTVTTINYGIYKKNTNREIAELKNEISNMKNEIVEIENKLVTNDTEEQNEHSETVEVVEDEMNAKPLFYLSDYQRQVAEYIVMGESGGEPYDGQVAVAQCILNACLRDGLQPSEVRTKYKYSGWNTNPNDSVKKAVSAVFDDGYKITDEYIMYFYAPKYSKGKWHETQKFVMEIGGHKFFAEW